MANHRAQQILDAVITAVTGLTTTASRVFHGRVVTLLDSDLPCICVYRGSNSPLPDGERYPVEDWAFNVVIEAKAKAAAASMDSTLFAIEKEVTAAIMGSPQLGLSFVLDALEQGSEAPRLDDALETPAASMAINFTFIYRRSWTDPSA